LVMAVLVSGLMADAKPSDNTNNAPQADERRSIEDEKWIEKPPMDEVEKRSFDFEKAHGKCHQPYVAADEAVKKRYDAHVKAGEAMDEFEKCMSSDKTNVVSQAMDAAERRSIEDKKWIAKAPMDEVEKRSSDFEKKAMGQCRQPYVAFEEAMKKKYDAGVKAGEAMHELEKCMFD